MPVPKQCPQGDAVEAAGSAECRSCAPQTADTVEDPNSLEPLVESQWKLAAVQCAIDASREGGQAQAVPVGVSLPEDQGASKAPDGDKAAGSTSAELAAANGQLPNSGWLQKIARKPFLGACKEPIDISDSPPKRTASAASEVVVHSSGSSGSGGPASTHEVQMSDSKRKAPDASEAAVGVQLRASDVKSKSLKAQPRALARCKQSAQPRASLANGARDEPPADGQPLFQNESLSTDPFEMCGQALQGASQVLAGFGLQSLEMTQAYRPV